MSKDFNLNFKNTDIMTFEQENELYAGNSIKVYHFYIVWLKFKQEEKQFELEFKVGQDIEWVKKCVAEKLDFGRNDFEIQFRIYVNRTRFLRKSYTLNDIPNLKDQSSILIKTKI